MFVFRALKVYKFTSTTYPFSGRNRYHEWCVTEGGNPGPSWTYAQNVLRHVKHQCRHTEYWNLVWTSPSIGYREWQSGGAEIWGRRALEFGFFFKRLTAEQYEPWANLSLKLPTAVWITPRFPHCFSTWTNKTYRNTIYTWEMAAEGNCCFCSPTSNTGHTHVLKRINLQQGTGNISLKFFGKLIMEVTVPFFSSKAIRSSFPHLPHFYLKVTKITNMCMTVGNSS